MQSGPLLTDESFLLNGGDDAIAMQQAGGAIVRGAESEDPGLVGGRHSRRLDCTADAVQEKRA